MAACPVWMTAPSELWPAVCYFLQIDNNFNFLKFNPKLAIHRGVYSRDYAICDSSTIGHTAQITGGHTIHGLRHPESASNGMLEWNIRNIFINPFAGLIRYHIAVLIAQRPDSVARCGHLYARSFHRRERKAVLEQRSIAAVRCGQTSLRWRDICAEHNVPVRYGSAAEFYYQRTELGEIAFD